LLGPLCGHKSWNSPQLMEIDKEVGASSSWFPRHLDETERTPAGTDTVVGRLTLPADQYTFRTIPPSDRPRVVPHETASPAQTSRNHLHPLRKPYPLPLLPLLPPPSLPPAPTSLNIVSASTPPSVVVPVSHARASVPRPGRMCGVTRTGQLEWW
jgi:hypothetical protein